MARFVILSCPGPVMQEAAHIHALFDAGMEVIHLRKPGYGKEALQQLLAQIDPQYYNRIALHQHHELAAATGIQRLHFPEALRVQQSESRLQEAAAAGFTLSTSMHDSSDYDQLSPAFAYTFLGPFAPSISKPGYGNTAPDISAVQKKKTALIALGGLQAENLLQPLSTGFDGVAVLGSIWKDDKVVENFKTLLQIWHTADHPF